MFALPGTRFLKPVCVALFQDNIFKVFIFIQTLFLSNFDSNTASEGVSIQISTLCKKIMGRVTPVNMRAKWPWLLLNSPEFDYNNISYETYSIHRYWITCHALVTWEQQTYWLVVFISGPHFPWTCILMPMPMKSPFRLQSL